MNRFFSRKSKDDLVVDSVAVCVTLIIFALVALPLIYVISSSLSDPTEVLTGRVTFYPRNFTLDGYKRIFEYDPIWIGYRNTIIYTVLGTTVNLLVTLPCAYALSRRDLLGRGFFTFLFTFTMFFNGGLIPTYLLIKQLGMLNTIWAC